MTFSLFVEDSYGSPFIKKLLRRKSEEGLLSAKPNRVKPSSIGNKLKRMVNAALLDADYVVILMDADGLPHNQKTEEIKRFLDDKYLNRVDIVLLDYEIEEWICYSQELPIGSGKPSKILRQKQNYEKRHLPKFAEKLDCKKLAECPSFHRFASALKSM